MTKPRKLNRSHRKALSLFGAQKFLDIQARVNVETAALELRNAILADHAKHIAPAIKGLDGTNLFTNIDRIHLPSTVTIDKGMKSFVRDDGVVVQRPDTFEMKMPPSNLFDVLKEGGNESFFNTGSDHYFGSSRYYASYDVITLEQSIALPRLPHGGKRYYINMGEDGMLLEGNRAPWLSESIGDLIIALFVAERDRHESECNLVVAMHRVIQNVATYEELLDIWPEAKEIEGDLFPPKVSKALIALTAEDKKLICDNLTQRGVESKVCKAA